MSTITPLESCPSNQVNLFYQEKILEEWFQAARTGDLGRLQTILKQNQGIIEVNTQAKIGGYTALHVAVDAAQLETVEWLLEQGADIWIRTDRNEVPKDGLLRASFVAIAAGFDSERVQTIKEVLEKKESHSPEPEREEIEKIINNLWKLAIKETPFTNEDKVSLKEILKQTYSLKYQNIAHRLNLIRNVCFHYQFLNRAITNKHPELLEELISIPNADPSGGEYDNTLLTACRAGASRCLKLLLDSEKVDPSCWGRGNPITTIVYPLQECFDNLWRGVREGVLRDEDIKTARVFINHPRVPSIVFTRDYYGVNAFDFLIGMVGIQVNSNKTLGDNEMKMMMNQCLDKLEEYKQSPENNSVTHLHINLSLLEVLDNLNE